MNKTSALLGAVGVGLLMPQPQLWVPQKPAIILPGKQQPPAALGSMSAGVVASSQDEGGAVGLSYVNSYYNGTRQSTFTYSAASIGTASVGRIVLVAVMSQNDGAINAVSIGGVSATAVIAETNSGDVHLAIYGLAVPTGTTADIVVTLSGNSDRTAIDVFSMTGQSSLSAYATATPVLGRTTTTTISLPVNVPANGAYLATFCSIGGTSGRSGDWTSSGDLTAGDFWGEVPTNSRTYHGSAHKNLTSAASPFTGVSTISGTTFDSSRGAGIATSFGPN